MDTNKKSSMLIILAAIVSALLSVFIKDGVESLITGASGAGMIIYRVILAAAIGGLIGWLMSLANK
jgi:hypothetical protein